MPQIGLNIGYIRFKKSLMQKEVAAATDLHPADYNKMEKGEREPSIEAHGKISKSFYRTVEQATNYQGNIPQEVTIEDKSVLEKMKLIVQLEEDDRWAIFCVIDSMFTKYKFKDFFNKNLAVL